MFGAAACSSPPSPPRVQMTAAQVIQRAAANPPVGARLPPTSADPCKAGELQWLVGRPRTEIPVPVDVVNRRVACTTCPVTEDYAPYRLNIFYNRQTELVEQVRCG